MLFASRGAKVAGTFLKDADAAKSVQDSIGGECIFVQTDVTDEKEVDSFFDQCILKLGTPTILVNSAGLNGAGIHICDMTLERWNQVLSANLTGPFLFCRRFAKERKSAGRGGKIINITSIHEEIAVAGTGEYCASKGGLRNLTRCLALELAPLDINVNNLAPGMILTPMNEEAVEHPDILKKRDSHIPLGRAGKPEEVANLALYLASPDSSYATGTTFFLDGGLMLSQGQGA